MTRLASKSRVTFLGASPAAHTRLLATAPVSCSAPNRASSLESIKRHAVGWEATSPKQPRLVSQHLEVRHAPAAIGQHHGQVDQHLAGRLPARPFTIDANAPDRSPARPERPATFASNRVPVWLPTRSHPRSPAPPAAADHAWRDGHALHGYALPSRSAHPLRFPTRQAKFPYQTGTFAAPAAR